MSHPLLIPCALLIPFSVGVVCSGAGPDEPVVLTQLPLAIGMAPTATVGEGVLEAGCGDGARIVMIGAGSERRVLTRDFHSACDPDVSFDGRRMLFVGKKAASGSWDIFEMELDGSGVRRVTDDSGDCRHPVYQGTFYTIDSEKPRHRITFVSTRAGEANEYGSAPSTSLYVTRMDGSATRRLTFNPSSDTDPTVLPDGRLLFSSWRRGNLDRGAFGHVSLFTAQTDGLDYAAFSTAEGGRVKRMPCVTADRLVVFVESDEAAWDGAGTLASVSLRRNLHSYRRITTPSDGLFHSPSPLPDGRVLVSRRSGKKGRSQGVYRLDPRTGQFEPLFDDPDYHDVQARRVGPRPRPDGRSSVLSEEHSTGKFYCLDVFESDLPEGTWIEPGDAPRLRVLEGIPRLSGSDRKNSPLRTRVLGEVPIEKDGSFNIEVPANLPLELQLLDADGIVLRSCGWVWVRNRETRGCIGCHEDGELTPENRFVDALAQPSVSLVPPHGEDGPSADEKETGTTEPDPGGSR